MSTEMFFLTYLKDLSDGDLALQLETMGDILEDHRAYKDQNLPPWIIGPADLRECSVDVKHSSAAAKQDDSKETERQLARQKGVQAITFASQYVVMFSAHENDPTLLENIGLEPRHRTFTKEAVRKPGSPTKFTVKHTGVSGSIKASVNRWEGKGSVELQICEGDPADEASWKTVDIFHSCRMRADGLEPAKKCYFRARLRNDAGKGPWSEIIELIIL